MPNNSNNGTQTQYTSRPLSPGMQRHLTPTLPMPNIRPPIPPKPVIPPMPRVPQRPPFPTRNPSQFPQPTMPTPNARQEVDPDLIKRLQEAAAKEDAEIAKTANAADSETAEKFALFAQNEHNGAIFYNNLQESAPSDVAKRLLSGISACARENSKKYADMYEQISGKQLEIDDHDISKPQNFHAGLTMAIAEEAEYLSELAQTFDESRSDRFAKRLNALILKKISDIERLAALRGI